MKKLYLYLPENLDIEDIIRKRRRLFYTQNLNEEKLLYVCSTILNARHSKRKEMEEKGTRFAPVCAGRLDKVIHNYRVYLDYLILTGIIETDNHYLVGEKCRGYCFKPPYRGQPLKKIEVSNYVLRKCIRRDAQERAKSKKKALKNHQYLAKWWDEPGLEIDVTGAIRWIEGYREENLNYILQQEQSEERDYYIDNLADTCEDFKRQVLSIHKRNHHYGFSGAGLRFYTPISNLKKELRAFLTYKGQPLMELDKKNSQPYFSLALLKQSFWQDETSEPRTLNLMNLFSVNITKQKKGAKEEAKKENRIGKDTYRKYSCDIIMLLENEQIQSSKGFGGFEKYIECVTGDFYQHMEDIFQPLYPDRFNNRSNVKKEVLRILYMDPKKDQIDFYKPAISFMSHFPFVYNLFSLIKKVDYTNLAIILQRIESFLFLDIICKRINEEHPKIPLFTIHDCILTTKGSEDAIKTIIEEELLRWIGYPATLHCKEVTKAYQNDYSVQKKSFGFKFQ